MLDAHLTELSFKNYLRGYDQTDEKIHLKIVHTFGVLKASRFLAKELRLNEEDTELAQIIAILHDIGRFEQLKRFNSFDDRNIDHAVLAVEILQNNQFIRKFIPSSQFDQLVYQVILNHSTYKIEDNLDERTLLHTKIIRDADKLDNYRVKEEEKIETLFDLTLPELERQKISPKIYQTFLNHHLIKKEDRETELDMWLSYIAFMFDLNFSSSFAFLQKNNYISILFNRIQPTDPETKEKMKKLEQTAHDYIELNSKNKNL